MSGRAFPVLERLLAKFEGEAEGTPVLVDIEDIEQARAELEAAKELLARNERLRGHLMWALDHVSTEMCGLLCDGYDDHHAKLAAARKEIEL